MSVQVLPVPADMLENIVFAVVVVPVGLVLGFEADAELDPVLRWDVGRELQDEGEGVGVLAAVHVVHEGAVDIGEAGPRVERRPQLHHLLEAHVPDLDGAGQRALLQRAVLQAHRVLQQAVPEVQVVGGRLFKVQHQAAHRADL